MACAIAGGALLMLLALLAPLAWERVRAERLKNLWKIACIAVQAAEQRGGSGAQKRAYAQALLRDAIRASARGRRRPCSRPRCGSWRKGAQKTPEEPTFWLPGGFCAPAIYCAGSGPCVSPSNRSPNFSEKESGRA